MRKNKLAMAGMIIIALLIILAVIAPYIMPYEYDAQDYNSVLILHSKEHPLGTDSLGRDVLSRLIYGTRVSLSLGILIVVTGAVIGIFLGGIAGFYGGRTDNYIMRFLDIYQSIPSILLAIALATVMGPGLKSTVIALGVASFPKYARLIRASILQVRELEYVEAARAIGGGNIRILVTHIIPNAFSPMIVFITMYLGSSILVAATLSFIGLGAQPPTPEWGAMLSSGRSLMRDYPTLVLYPGIMIMITVLAFNVFGDGLRDALDPRLND
jgi:peptide/nickel transport system permease protein